MCKINLPLIVHKVRKQKNNLILGSPGAGRKR